MTDDLQLLWKEREEFEEVEAEEPEDDDFLPATTIEDYERANPDKAGAEVLIHIDL